MSDVVHDCVALAEVGRSREQLYRRSVVNTLLLSVIHVILVDKLSHKLDDVRWNIQVVAPTGDVAWLSERQGGGDITGAARERDQSRTSWYLR